MIPILAPIVSISFTTSVMLLSIVEAQNIRGDSLTLCAFSTTYGTHSGGWEMANADPLSNTTIIFRRLALALWRIITWRKLLRKQFNNWQLHFKTILQLMIRLPVDSSRTVLPPEYQITSFCGLFTLLKDMATVASVAQWCDYYLWAF